MLSKFPKVHLSRSSKNQINIYLNWFYIFRSYSLSYKTHQQYKIAFRNSNTFETFDLYFSKIHKHFYYISNFHSSYFIFFVYFDIFWYILIYFVYIYIYILCQVPRTDSGPAARVYSSTNTARTPKATLLWGTLGLYALCYDVRWWSVLAPRQNQ